MSVASLLAPRHWGQDVSFFSLETAESDRGCCIRSLQLQGQIKFSYLYVGNFFLIIVSRDIQKLERRLKALSQKVYIVCIVKRLTS